MRGNGPSVGFMDLGALLDPQRAERERRAKLTPEERAAEAKEAFTKLLDAAIQGCEDHNHRAVEEHAIGVLRGMFDFAVLPEPVANAVARVLVNKAMHDGDPADGLKWLLSADTITNALVIAGATLRFAQHADTAGVPTSTGVYL